MYKNKFSAQWLFLLQMEPKVFKISKIKLKRGITIILSSECVKYKQFSKFKLYD